MAGVVVAHRPAVRIREAAHRPAQQRGQVVAPGAHLLARAVRRQRRQHRVVHRVAADLMARVGQLPQLRVGEHQVVRHRAHRQRRQHPPQLRLALVRRQVLQLHLQRRHRLQPLLHRRHRMHAHAHRRQVQHRPRHAPHEFDHRVAEHAAAVEVAGGDEHGRARAVARQDRMGHGPVVGVAVVEGDAGRAPRQATLAQRGRGVADRHQREMPRQEGHLRLEARRVDLARAQRVGRRQHAVIDQDAQRGLAARPAQQAQPRQHQALPQYGEWTSRGNWPAAIAACLRCAISAATIRFTTTTISTR